MEGKQVLVLNVMVLTLLMSLLVASARRPLVGLPFAGKQQRLRGDLTCCDSCNCDYNRPDWSCTCYDTTQGYCLPGCYDCQCDGMYSCQCYDALWSCPGPCNDYIDEAPGKTKSKPHENALIDPS